MPLVASAATPETLIVTGHFQARDIEQQSSVIAVMDRAAIQALNKTSVVDVLRAMPGVQVSQEGGPGGIISVSLRGGEPNFAVVLIDGVPVNDPTNTRGGSFDFSNLDVALIERIEVVKGPQSAIYGSDALSGVINLITTQAEPVSGHTLRAEGGDDGFRAWAYRGVLAGERAALSVNAGQRDHGEPVAGSTHEGRELSLRGRVGDADGYHLTLGLRRYESDKTSFPEQSGGPERARDRRLDDSHNEDDSGFAALHLPLLSWWNTALQADRFEHRARVRSPGIAPYDNVPPNDSEAQYLRDDLRWLNTFTPLDEVTVSLGVDRRREEGDSEGSVSFQNIPLDALSFFLGAPSLPVAVPGSLPVPITLETNFKLDRDIRGAFADLRYLAEAGWLLQGSIRADAPEDSNDETTRRLGARYPFGDSGFSVSANWGEGFKLPSFFALGHPLVGNPALKPERAESADVGLQWRARSGERIAGEAMLTMFDNRFEDLIDFDPDSFANVNRSQVQTRGAELEFSWRPRVDLRLRVHATYTDIDVDDSERKLAGRPRWKAGWQAHWEMAENWLLHLDHQWTGHSYATSYYTGSATEHRLDDYHRVDLSLRWRMSRTVEIAAALSNVLDEDYEEAVGFPGGSRSGRLGVTLSF